MPKLFKSVFIVGTGLIGGSLGEALLRHGLTDNVIGFDAKKKNTWLARRRGLITHVTQKFEEPCQKADLVVLAAPVDFIPDLMRKIVPHVTKSTLVIDVGSTKTDIVRTGDRCFPCGQFVGCHPMAGSERCGPDAAQGDLFLKKKCFIVPGKKTSSVKVRLAKKMWRLLGAEPVCLTSIEHDLAMAVVSHFPQLVSSALAASVAQKKNWRAVKNFSGNGWRDTTRIAASGADLWLPVFRQNRDSLLDLLTRFQQILKIMEGALRRHQDEPLRRLMKMAQEFKNKTS